MNPTADFREWISYELIRQLKVCDVMGRKSIGAVPAREEECPFVDDEGRVIACLTVVDILGRVVSSDE